MAKRRPTLREQVNKLKRQNRNRSKRYSKREAKEILDRAYNQLASLELAEREQATRERVQNPFRPLH